MCLSCSALAAFTQVFVMAHFNVPIIFLLCFFAGRCLFLSKTRSELKSYDCRTFDYGCPDRPYFGSSVYKCENFQNFQLLSFFKPAGNFASASKLKHTTISMRILIGSSNSVYFASQIESQPLKLTNCIKCAFGEKFWKVW